MGPGVAPSLVHTEGYLVARDRSHRIFSTCTTDKICCWVSPRAQSCLQAQRPAPRQTIHLTGWQSRSKPSSGHAALSHTCMLSAPLAGLPTVTGRSNKGRSTKFLENMEDKFLIQLVSEPTRERVLLKMLQRVEGQNHLP